MTHTDYTKKILRIEDNNIYFHIEDDDKYSIEDINTMELLDVCTYIVEYV